MDATLWRDMFHLRRPVLEKILRPVAVYAFLVVSLRLAGKRELAQLNPFDLVVLLTLSNTVQNAIIGDDNSVTGGLIGATTLLGVNYLVVRFLYRHEALERLVEGDAEVERAVLEPGGSISFIARKPTPDVTRHEQVLARLDEIARLLAAPRPAPVRS